MTAFFSLSLRERVGVREAARANHRDASALRYPARLCLASLTPTLSRREREQARAVFMDAAAPFTAARARAGERHPFGMLP